MPLEDLCMGEYGSKLYEEPQFQDPFFRQSGIGTDTTNVVAGHKGDARRPTRPTWLRVGWRFRHWEVPPPPRKVRTFSRRWAGNRNRRYRRKSAFVLSLGSHYGKALFKRVDAVCATTGGMDRGKRKFRR